MNYWINKKCLEVFDEFGEVRLVQNNVEIVKETTDGTKLVYTSKVDDSYFSDLYYVDFDDLSNPKLLGKKVRIIEYSIDFTWLLILVGCSDENTSGDLCYFENLKKKLVIDKKVYVSPVFVVGSSEKYLGDFSDFEIIYTKRREKKFDGAYFPYVYDFYRRTKEANIEKIATNVESSVIFNKTQSDISMVFKVPNKKEWPLGNLYIYDEQEIKLIEKNVYSKFSLNADFTQISYYRVISDNKGEWIVTSLDLKKSVTLLTTNDNDFNLKHNTIINTYRHLNIPNGKYIDFDYQENNNNIIVDQKSIEKYRNTFISEVEKFPLDKDSILKEDEFIFYFRKKKKRNFEIVLHLALRLGKCVLLDNYFQDDDSQNYMVKFNASEIDKVAPILILLNVFPFIKSEDYIWGKNLYDVSMEDIILGCETPYGIGWINHGEVSGLKFKSFYYKKIVIEIVEQLMFVNDCKDKAALKRKLSSEYKIICDANDRTRKFFLENYPAKSKAYEKIKEQAKEIEKEMVISGELKSKWTSEENLFKLIVSKFPNAKMHSSPSWLKRQHLDVFIEENKLAFEYQGLQHYQPIAFFGGKSGFLERVELDKQKKRLCKENGVTLIEWKYDEPINLKTLKNKLKEAELIKL